MKNSKIYTILDTVSEEHSTPFYSKNDDTAKRDFYNVIDNPETLYGATPKDFKLYRLGSWNNETGFIRALKLPEFIAEAITHE